MGNNELTTTKNAGELLAILIAMQMRVRRGVHRPMEHIQGFTRNHWMLPLVECLHHIALAAVMVGEFLENTQNDNKTQLLDCNYHRTCGISPANVKNTRKKYCSCWAGAWYFHCYDSHVKVVFWIFLAHPLFNAPTHNHRKIEFRTHGFDVEYCLLPELSCK